MPFELGMDVGCKTYSPSHSAKSFLVFESKKYGFHRFISDISGQDIQCHSDDPEIAVKTVRDWLRTESGQADIPGGAVIYQRYKRFRKDLPVICTEMKLDLYELTFVDFSYTIATWLHKQS